jgi:hypothetical protein
MRNRGKFSARIWQKRKKVVSSFGLTFKFGFNYKI